MLLLHKFRKMYGEGVAVWLQPATRRTIQIHKRFFLSFPSMVFRVHYRAKFEGNNLLCRSLRVGFLTTNDKPRGNSSVYVPPLPNILWNEYGQNEVLHVCLGQTVSAPDLTLLINAVIANFFATKFNNEFEDTGKALYENKEMFLGETLKWAKETTENPSWVPKSKDLIKWGDFKNFTAIQSFITPFEEFNGDED